MSELIKLKNDCRTHVERCGIIATVSKLVRDIPNLDKIKNDIDLLRFIISSIVEIMNPKVKEKLKPEDIAYDIYIELFPSTLQDAREMVKKNLDHLVNNKQIDKVTFFKRNSKRLSNFLKPKL